MVFNLVSVNRHNRLTTEKLAAEFFVVSKYPKRIVPLLVVDRKEALQMPSLLN